MEYKQIITTETLEYIFGHIQLMDLGVCFFAFLVVTFGKVNYDSDKIKKKGKKFHLKIWWNENIFRVIYNFLLTFVLLFGLPEGWVWYAEKYSGYETGTATWNTFFSMLIGFFALPIFMFLKSKTNSKLRSELE